jgi:opacity protein-like surface antigen
MRTLKMLLALALIAALTVPAFGQRTPGGISIGGFAGMGMLQKPEFIKKSWKNTIGYGGELKYTVNETTSLAAGYTLIPFKLNVDDVFGADAAGVSISGGELKTGIISANLLKYFTSPEASAGFYLTLGGGYYMFTFNDIKVDGVSQEVTDQKTEKKFGLNGGLGLEIKMADKLALFAEGKYHYVFTKEEKNVEADMKGKLQFITVMGGLRFSLQ